MTSVIRGRIQLSPPTHLCSILVTAKQLLIWTAEYARVYDEQTSLRSYILTKQLATISNQHNLFWKNLQSPKTGGLSKCQTVAESPGGTFAVIAYLAPSWEHCIWL